MFLSKTFNILHTVQTDAHEATTTKAIKKVCIRDIFSLHTVKSFNPRTLAPGDFHPYNCLFDFPNVADVQWWTVTV